MSESQPTGGFYKWKAQIQEWWLRQKCPTEFLCDNCKYDHPSACHRPQRPNAIKCPDYRPRT